LIDVMRNNRTNTSVAAYSLRARAGAPVSYPLAWEDLTPGLKPSAFTVASVLERARRGPDAWADYWTTKQLIGGGDAKR
jgi:bifunctional non-homologous end joining protein LigD